MKFLNTFTRCALTVAMLLLCVASAWSQRTVRGKVTDAESGEALIGATVAVVGTTRGATTDVDGNYSVEVPAGAQQIRFAYTGYAETVITLGSSDQIDIGLQAGSVLDEVVVVGYGSVKKSDATGAVTSVTEENFNRGLIAAPEQLIQGRAAGVQVTNTNGEPGGGINIRIRGTASVRSGNNPLFVVDGVPLGGGDTQGGGQDAGFGTQAARNPLNFLNPSDIASIDILKDASATAIYGSRGANGVVIITTKKGQSGRGSLTYDYTLGVSNIAKKFDLLGRDEFLSAYAEFNGAAAAAQLDGGTETDWQDEIFRTAYTHSHNLSFGGGDRGGDYRFSVSYQNQEGIVNESGLQRYSARFNGNKKFLDDRLTLGTQVTISQVHDDNAPISNTVGFEGDLIGAALKANPTLPVRYTEDSLQQKSQTEPNPVAYLEYTKDFTNTIRALGSMFAEVRLFEGLSFRTVVGFDQAQSSRKSAYSRKLNFGSIFNRGRLFTTNTESGTRLWENYFTYDKAFGSTTLNAVLGYSYQRFDFSQNITELTKFRTDDLDLMINNAASALQGANDNSVVLRNSSGNRDELQSYFGRVNLGFADKYLFTATLRADGSTRFGSNNKYGYFPAFAFKWRLGSESFMPEALSSLGVRLGYGLTGNQEIGHNQYSSRERYNDWDIDANGNIGGGGLSFVAFTNPDLKWESTQQINFGVDYAFADGRVAGSIDFYDKRTEDLLFLVVAAQPAVQNFNFENIEGTVINQGVELSVNLVAVDKPNFSWNVLLNTAYNKNVVEGLTTIRNTGRIHGQGLSEAFAQRIVDGEPLFAFFVRDFAGFDDNGISVYNDGDFQQSIGSPLPTVTGGLTNSFSFGNFDASIFFNGVFGNKVYNNTANAFFTAGALANGRNVSTDVPGNGESNLNAPDVSTRFLEDGSFVRLQDLTIGYRVKTKSRNISGLRFFVTGQNLATFTNYSGQDPEVSINKAIDDIPSVGIDYVAYPRARTILIGGSVSF